MKSNNVNSNQPAKARERGLQQTPAREVWEKPTFERIPLNSAESGTGAYFDGSGYGS